MQAQEQEEPVQEEVQEQLEEEPDVQDGLTTRHKKLPGVGTRTLPGAPAHTTRNKKLLRAQAVLLGARTLVGAPGLCTRNKKLLEAPGRTTRSKDATRGSWPYY